MATRVGSGLNASRTTPLSHPHPSPSGEGWGEGGLPFLYLPSPFPLPEGILQRTSWRTSNDFYTVMYYFR
jgi:hypothetical protein